MSPSVPTACPPSAARVFCTEKVLRYKFEQQMDQSNVFNLDYKTLFFFLNKANCLSLKCYECGRVLRTLPDHTPNAARLPRQLKKTNNSPHHSFSSFG